MRIDVADGPKVRPDRLGGVDAKWCHRAVLSGHRNGRELVRFNDAETAWECPCHGSRFGTDGSVLQGPATRPLERRDPLT